MLEISIKLDFSEGQNKIKKIIEVIQESASHLSNGEENKFQINKLNFLIFVV